jgi:predicted enzyme related to lactoylglutathione lyase
MSEQPTANWQSVVPLLQVSNLAETLEYYEAVLGFRIVSLWPDAHDPKWAHVVRGQTRFILTFDLGASDRPFIAEKGNGVVLYVVVDDIDAAYEELETRGAIVVQDMVDFGGRRQFSIGELNGYVLAFVEGFDL